MATSSIKSSTKSLANMSAAERLAYYRAATQSVKAKEPDTTWAERVGKFGADFSNFGTNTAAAYKFHRVQ